MDIDKAVRGFISLVVGIGNFFLEPWIITVIWGWFLVPWGFPAMLWTTAFGANLVFNLFAGPPHKKYEGDKLIERGFTVFIYNLVALSIAFLVHAATR